MAVDECLEVSDKFTLIIICVMSFCKVFLTNPMLDDSLCNLDLTDFDFQNESATNFSSESISKRFE